MGIVRKCLAREPEKRFADAGSLAIDLRRCLIEPPSAEAAKRTPADGAGPRRRLLHRPAAVAVLTVAVAVFAVAAANFLGRVDQGMAWHVADRDRSVEQGSRQRQRNADALHTLADRLRFLDGLESLPANRLRILEAGCGKIWRERSRLTNRATGSLVPEIERRVRTDLLELAILWGDLHVRLAPAEQLDQARREALQVLTQAEAELGSSVVLDLERQTYAEALGLSDESRQARDSVGRLEPHTVWEHYAIGRSLLRAGKREDAAVEFQHAVDLEPQSLWPNFYAGTCAYRLQEYEAALAAFSACVALAPDKAECYSNRGLAYRALGREDLAARDFECARRLDSFAGH